MFSFLGRKVFKAALNVINLFLDGEIIVVTETGTRGGFFTQSIAVGILALSGSAVQAATFYIDSTADGSDSNLGDGMCQTITGDCTLKAAIEEANRLAGPDTIHLPSGVYFTGQLDVVDDLTLLGSEGTILDGSNSAPYIFKISPSVNNASPSFTASELTIQRARNSSIASLSAITNLRGGSTLLHKVVITNNFATLNGGGIYNLGSIDLRRCEVSDNKTDNNGAGANGRGGGIFNAGSITIKNSLIRANTAGKGGGLMMNGGTAKIVNSTVTENVSLAEGGGIGVPFGSVDIIHSTITKNKTATHDEASRRHGGGIYVDYISGNKFGRVNISNSIVAGNFGGSHLQSDSIDCYADSRAELISYRNNIIGELTSDCNIRDYESSDLTGITFGSGVNPLDAGLSEELDSSLGSPASYTLLAGSPALDAVTLMLPEEFSQYRCEGVDQQGGLRPAASEYGTEAICDIGAYELHKQTTIIEAEDAFLIGDFTSGPCAEGSGGQCVSAYGSGANEYDGADNANRMIFNVFVEQAGYYSFAAWVKAASEANNSFYVSIDDQEPFIWDTQVTGEQFTVQPILKRHVSAQTVPESDYGFYHLSKGNHTVELFLREGGTILDRIALSKAASDFEQLLAGDLQASSEQVTAFSNTDFKFFQAYQAGDSNLHTEWRSHESEGDSAWIQTEFSAPHAISKVVLHWSTGYLPRYKLQVSSDGQKWKTIYEGTASDSRLDEIAVGDAGKYVRMQGVNLGAWSRNYALKEFEVYGAPIAEPTDFGVIYNEVDANFSPYVSDNIDDIVLKKGQGSYTINLNNVFTDPDGALLNFNKDGSNSDSPNVRFTDASRTAIKISASELGTERYDITASDENHDEVTLSFNMTVLPENIAPTIVNDIDDIVMLVGQACQVIDLYTVFKDADSDTLHFSKDVSHSDSPNVRFLGSYSLLNICPEEVGVQTVDLKAIDGNHAEAELEFTVSVFDGATEVVQPAEMVWSNATIDSNHAGYTGQGFLNTANETATWFEMPIYVADAGYKQVTVHYANGSTNRPLDVYMDEELVNQVSMISTGSWSSWSSEQVVVEALTPGLHTLRFQATTSGGAPNIDRVAIQDL